MNHQMYSGMNYPTSSSSYSNAHMQGEMNYSSHSIYSYPTSTPTQGGMSYPTSTSSQMQGTLVYPSTTSDPVSTAVANHVASTSHPTIKKSVRCNDCNLDFTSQVVLDAHLQGARHAKQMKSKNILESLEQKNVPFSKEQDANGLKCNACNVFLNSLQQLQTHLNGNRHKKKISKGDWAGKEIISKADVAEIPQKSLPRPADKNTLLSCKTCNKFFNSQSQLSVHLTSQKHQDKISGRKSEKAKRFSPYWKSKISSSYHQATQKPLTNSFVSGGYQQYA